MKKRNFIHITLILFIFILILAACGQSGESNLAGKQEKAAKGNKVIRVGTSGKTIPSSYYDDNKKLVGYDIDVINEIAKRSGYKVEYTVADFSGLFGLIESNRIDTIANQAEITPEREKKFNFTEPYVYSAWQLVVRGDDDKIQSLEDLDGKIIAQGMGTAKEKYLEDYKNKHGIDFDLKSYEDSGGIFLDIVNKRLDANLVDYPSGLIKIEKSGLDLKYAGDPFEPTVFAFPFKKDNQELQKLFDEKLAELKEDGTLKKLSEKWFKLDVTKPLDID